MSCVIGGNGRTIKYWTLMYHITCKKSQLYRVISSRSTRHLSKTGPEWHNHLGATTLTVHLNTEILQSDPWKCSIRIMSPCQNARENRNLCKHLIKFQASELHQNTGSYSCKLDHKEARKNALMSMGSIVDLPHLNAILWAFEWRKSIAIHYGEHSWFFKEHTCDMRMP